MTRTPDEIKKAMEEELPVHYHIDGEPRLTPRQYMELQWLHKDALALIQQLEDHLREATKKIEQLEAERDAAMESMRKDPHCCFHCKHKGKWPSCNSDPRPNGSCFEWRGVQKEGTK